MAKKRKKFIPAHAALSKDVAALIGWVRFLNQFRSIERLIWFKGVESRERNGEHCYQLAMLAWFIAERSAKHLNIKKLLLYALVHDLRETYGQDTPAFAGRLGTYNDGPTHETKEEREAAAHKRIEAEWRFTFPQVMDWIEAYEAKEDEEGRFIYALDKLLSEINIFEDLGRTDKALGVPMQDKFEYKRTRIAKHPLILEYFDEFWEFWRMYHADRTYVPEETKEAAE